MKDVLFGIGTVVEAETEQDGQFCEYLIIGKRAYNPRSGKSWDYIGVPLPDGFKMISTCERPYENTNLYFFNHTDIRSVNQNDPK